MTILNVIHVGLKPQEAPEGPRKPSGGPDGLRRPEKATRSFKILKETLTASSAVIYVFYVCRASSYHTESIQEIQ